VATRFDRIVLARMQLLRRHEARMQSTPSLSDTSPRGSGPPNRHGMPRLPVGQTETKKWPVLDLGVLPNVAARDWRLRIDGACAQPTTLDFEQFLALPQTEDTSDFHCYC
jgi:DMSO/TMAO reductase YedYZ molybdopterin-dependent catalytic subunit